jgi:hypothetical protein
VQELVLQLLALDHLLGSLPLHQQQDLDLDTSFLEDVKALNLKVIKSPNTTPSWAQVLDMTVP